MTRSSCLPVSPPKPLPTITDTDRIWTELPCAHVWTEQTRLRVWTSR
ncbi:MAG TPA: hypothetical protein VH575_26500 [Gemmataceae bacterium]